MGNQLSRPGRDAPCAILFGSVCCAAVTVLLASCSPALPVQRETQQVEGGPPGTQYSIVCVIHGDGDYLFHDTSGNEYMADEEALAGAKRVAGENPHAEVFIFHQRPTRQVLFLFPLRDGEFYYYRGGRLIAQESYWRDQERSRLEPEVELYHRFRAGNLRDQVSVFLYCGHEIPELGGTGYDASYPERPFTVRGLADGLQDFTRDSARFDLMVLSTCFGGTPYTIGALGSAARYVIASPENLHLSYFDFRPLERLDLALQDGNVLAFANSFARQAFDRLTGDIQTAVSVAVYDIERVQDYLRSVRGMYEHSWSAVGGETQAARASIEHCDCADLPAYVLPTMHAGVDVLYRPARFGRSQYKQAHSGWECWHQR
jgi:hypothetical protein